MCGIFALVRDDTCVSPDDIRRACSLLRYRGPDQSGYALLNGQTIGFGHNRLSIQDPNAPPQPLVDRQTGTTIIFNGEVYDHIEIGRILTKEHDITLTESTDTAVVLALYILYGPTAEFFCRLNGEFAFVIWDAQRKYIVAARDRFGIKPLCWYYDNTKLAFASEVKAIASLSGVGRKLSTEWLDRLDPGFRFPSQLTFMEGVYNVLPGQYLTMDLSTPHWNTPKYATYWSASPLLSSLDTSISYDEAKAGVRRLITAAVKRRLVADREMCVYLSGGVDSTVVCAVAHSLGHPLTCITVGFGDNAMSEEDVAVKSAKHYSLPHKCLTFTSADAAKYLEKTIYHTEIPIMNPHSIAKLRLSEFAMDKDFVVSLTGEGSDEILLGYAPFRSDLLLEMLGKGGDLAAKAKDYMSEVLSKECTSVLTGTMPDYIPKVRGVSSWQAWHFNRLQTLLDDLRAPRSDGSPLPMRRIEDFAGAAPRCLSSVRMAQFGWFSTLNNYVIPVMGDRVEMTSSIEGRPPFLDAAFTDYALRLPQDYLLDPKTLREKKILYDAFDDILPPHIRSRTKQPFFAPPWSEALFETEEGRTVREKYLSQAALERTGVWSSSKVDEMVARLRGGAKELDVILSMVLSVQILHALFIQGDIGGDSSFPMIDKSPGSDSTI